jgi:hypothetical protein
MRLLGGIASNTDFADAHPARAQVAEQATLHPDMAAAPPEPQAVGAHVRDFAVLEQDIPGAVEHHGGLIEGRGGLARTVAPAGVSHWPWWKARPLKWICSTKRPPAGSPWI